MRILVLLTEAYGAPGGIEQFNRDLLSALCSHRDVSQVVAVPRLQITNREPLPEKLTYVTEGLNSKVRFVLTVLRAAYTRGDFDLIVVAHVNLLPLLHFLHWMVRAPVLLVVHGCDAWAPQSRFVRHSLKAVDWAMSVSELTKARFCDWSRFPSDRVFLLPNCVDLDRFSPGSKGTALEERYGLKGRTVLMTFGRLSASERAKGFDEVLEVLPELQKQIPGLCYLICGDGSDRYRLERKAKELKIEKDVVFAGYVDESEKTDHFRLADAYVMPSRMEGFGIVLLEALACGIPVVASKIDGSREAVHNGEWGVLVDPDNPEEIKAGIMEALRRPKGVRPQGLEYCDTANFEQRIHRIVSAILEAGRKDA